MSGENRTIAHMDLDAFFVSVEVKKNRKFAGKPIIIGGQSQRGVVASCSYEARKAGVHSAMPIKMAKRLCPEAQIIKGDMESYAKESSLVTSVISDRAPLFEKASIDEFYLDLSGMDQYFGCYKWTKELREKIIFETGLPISFGISINKLISKVSTGQVKPNGKIEIQKGKETDFLHPLPVKKLPGVGKVTQHQLFQMGVKTIKTLSELPRELLEGTFGKHGQSLWQKSRGIDHSPVIPYREQKSMSKETTLKEDTLNLNFITARIVSMVEVLAYDLRKQKKLCGCISIKIRYSDFNTYSKQKVIPYTSLDKPLIEEASRLFEKLYTQRKMIRLIGVRFSKLVDGAPQISLFDNYQSEIPLLKSMDTIKDQYGKYAIRRASSLPE
jgi:DNA polymerase-4